MDILAVRLVSFASLGSTYLKKACLLLFMVGMLPLADASAEFKIVATGDSLTNGYSPVRLTDALAENEIPNETVTVASGGCNSARYVGRTIDPHVGKYRDFAAETLTHDPDVIIFLLGTNDAYRMANYVISGDAAGLADAFDTYRSDIAGAFDIFDGATNSEGRSSAVIVSTILPIVPHESNSRVDEQNLVISALLNPWLKDQAAERGFFLKDMNALIQSQNNWQDFYSDSAHLWANDAAGYEWMGREFADTVATAIPEPISLSLLVMGGLGLVRIRKR